MARKPVKPTRKKRAARVVAGVAAVLVLQAVKLASSGPVPFDPKWIQTAQDVRAVIDGCYFSEESGRDVVDFFAQYLRHSKGDFSGQPFILQPWQADITMKMFGWKRADHTRRFRTAYIEVPKKNGKSTLIAGFQLYLWLGEGEPGADCYCAAVDKAQGAIVFDEIANMVRQSSELVEAFNIEIVDSKKIMRVVDETGRTVHKLEVLSADVPSKEGLNIHSASVDELHAHKSRAMWSTLQYGGAARLQPMLMMITTAGVYDQRSIGWQKHELARKVIDGTVEDWTFFAVIYAAGDKDDWRKESTHRKANPCYGITINPQTFSQECKASQYSPADEEDFKRYRLNIWGRRTTRAIDMTIWAKGAGASAPMAPEQLHGRVCDLGLDLSSVNDLTAAVYAFPGSDGDDEAVDVFARFWIPEYQLTNEKNPNRQLYRQWVDAGYMETVPGRVIDYDVIKAAIMEDAERFVIRDINIDFLFQGQHLATQLAQEGFTEGERLFGMRQGFLSFGPAYREFKRLYFAGKVHHGNNPVLAWSAENTETAKDPAGNEKIVKPNSHLKVDPMVALVMAIDRTRRHAGGDMPEDTESDYEKEGLVVF